MRALGLVTNCNFAFRHGKHTPKSIGKAVKRAHRIIGGHVYHAGVEGGFFQHVCGNSEPVSAS